MSLEVVLYDLAGGGTYSLPAGQTIERLIDHPHTLVISSTVDLKVTVDDVSVVLYRGQTFRVTFLNHMVYVPGPGDAASSRVEFTHHDLAVKNLDVVETNVYFAEFA